MTTLRWQRLMVSLGGGVALAAVVFGAVTLATGDEPAGDPSSTTDPPATDAEREPVVTAADDVADPWAYPSQYRGGELLVGTVGERGQNAVTRRFAPSTVDLRWDFFCAADGGPGLDVRAEMTIKGYVMGGGTCHRGDRPGQAGYSSIGNPDRVERRWADLGVRPGEEVTVRLRLTDRDGGSLDNPRARLGFAIYERVRQEPDQDRFTEVRGVRIPTEQRVGERTYALERHRSLTLSAERSTLRSQVPAATDSPYPPYVGFGLLYPGGRGPAVNLGLRIDGPMRHFTVSGNLNGAALDDAQAHRVSMTVTAPRAVGGVLVIGVYRLVLD